MTDREYLELAAKAAGMKPGTWFDGWNDEGRETGDYWNPLTDDGDALRLAVKLNLLIDCNYCCAMALDFPDRDWWGGGEDERAGVAHDECDPYAATRRAIVRAAAEIGRSKHD